MVQTYILEQILSPIASLKKGKENPMSLIRQLGHRTKVDSQKGNSSEEKIDVLMEFIIIDDSRYRVTYMMRPHLDPYNKNIELLS